MRGLALLADKAAFAVAPSLLFANSAAAAHRRVPVIRPEI